MRIKLVRKRLLCVVYSVGAMVPVILAVMMTLLAGALYRSGRLSLEDAGALSLTGSAGRPPPVVSARKPQRIARQLQMLATLTR